MKEKKEEQPSMKEVMESSFRVGKTMGEIVGAEEERIKSQQNMMMRTEQNKKNYSYLFNQMFFTFLFIGNLMWFGLAFGKILDTATNNMALFWILIFAMNVYITGYLMFNNTKKAEAHQNE